MFIFFILFAQILFAHDLKTLSLEEKIGQLFVVPAKYSEDGSHRQDLINIIHNYHVGGIILKQGDPLCQVKLIEELQAESKIPLLCVQDAEWGLSMRLKNTVKFPRNLTLGAIQDNSLIYRLGKEIGRTCKLVGTHLNLAPVVDVNSNPKNLVIHTRSFGENPENVASKALAYISGIKSEGILTCAKHFPGHGDTSVDSHIDLPIITKFELVPFAAAIKGGVPCIMTAHLGFPSLPITFSSKIVTDLLKREMGFQGLVITDALNMKALTNYTPAEEIGLKALLAGHDLLLYGDHIAPNIVRILTQDVPQAFNRIKKAIIDGELAEEELDAHVEKILKTKETLPPLPSTDHLLDAINSVAAKELKRELYQNAITLVSDPKGLIPLSSPDDATIISLYETPTPEIIESIQKKEKEKPVIVVLFQTPYSLFHFDKSMTLIMAYENDPDAEEAAKDVISGKLIPIGKLPISY